MNRHTSGTSARAHRLRLALASGVALSVLALAGCSGTTTASELPTSMDELVEQATTEGEVDWYAPKPQEQMQGAIDLFETTYPGITVKYTNTKAPDLVSQLRLQEAARKVEVDVAAAGELTVPPSVGFADSIDWTAYGVDEDDTAFDGKLVYIYAAPKVWAYNTTLLDPAAAPTSWEDILDTGLPGNQIAIEGRGSFLTVWDVSPDLGAEAGVDWATQLETLEPHYTPNTTEAEQLIESGQVAIGTSLMNLALAGKESGAPIEIAAVSPTGTNETFMYVPKGAPHPAAAVLLTSFLSTDEAQAELAKDYNSRIPRNTDCSVPDENAVVKILCDNGVEWFSTGTLEAYQGLAEYFPEVEKALGTYVG